MLDSRYSVDVSLCFCIKDSDFFGGDGSVGYSKISYENVKDIDNLTPEKIDEHILGLSNYMKVPIENISVISKKEYDEITDEEADTMHYMIDDKKGFVRAD